MSKRNEPPPGPAPDASPESGPVQPTGSATRTVQFRGEVQLFVSDMPEASFVDLTDSGTHPVFALCWIDKDRAKSVHVTFPPGSGLGVFQVALDFRDNDTDKLKVQLCMRMQDPQSSNRRTVPLTTSCANMRTMLAGKPDAFRMPDQFIEGSFVNVTMRIENHQDFVHNPLTLRASHLDRLPEFNKQVKRVANAFEENNVLNKTQFLHGSESMRDGSSRCLPPAPLVILALALGTPAYSLMCWQPRVLRTPQHPDGRAGDGGPHHPLRDHGRAGAVREPTPAPRHRPVPRVPQGGALWHVL